jgi:cytoskeleton protein RodZ
VQVVLKARSDAWVTVSDGSGKVIFPGHILQPGDTYSVPPNASNAELWTGNLGGLEIIVNGKTMPRIGAIGQSKRNIPLNPEQLIAFINSKHH